MSREGWGERLQELERIAPGLPPRPYRRRTMAQQKQRFEREEKWRERRAKYLRETGRA